MSEVCINFLRVHRSTQGLNDAQIRKLAKHAEIVQCYAGEVIQRPDEHLEALLLVVAGRLTVSFCSSTGDAAPFQQLGLDDQFGLLLLESDAPFPVQLTADHNATLLRIPKDSAVQLLKEIPLWRRNLFRTVGPRLLEVVSSTKRPKIRRFVVFLHLTDETRNVSKAVVQRLEQLGERVCLLSDRETAFDSSDCRFEPLLDSSKRLRASEEIRKIVARESDASRVILEGQFSVFEDRLPTITDWAGAVYLVCQDESTKLAASELKSIIGSSHTRKEKLFVVRVIGRDKKAATNSPDLAAFARRDFKVHWDSNEPNTVCNRFQGIERIIHQLRGISVGLALGGGAARGMAHLGVLQVLERAGVVIDQMSGTSAGALVGVPYAAGFSASFGIDAFPRDLNPPWYFRALPRGDALYLLDKYRRNGWESMLRKYLHSWCLEQLAVPFNCVACDLLRAEQVIRNSGDATHAILESINLPILSLPICRDGRTLVDGGVFNVLPADVLANSEASVVIASDVASQISMDFAGNRPNTVSEEMHRPSTYQTAVRVREVQDRNLRAVGGRAADIVIEPDVSEFKLTDFKLTKNIAERGSKAAEKALPQVLQTLHDLDPALFPKLDQENFSEAYHSLL